MPSEYDFGEVAVGESKTMTFTINNINGHILRIDAIMMYTGSDASFRVVDDDGLPYEIGSTESTSFVLEFAPTAEGEVSGNIVVLSNDLVQPMLLVPLTGTGVDAQPITIDDLLEFFNDSIDEGSLWGRGHNERVAKVRVKVFRNGLRIVRKLIDRERYNAACRVLSTLYRRVAYHDIIDGTAQGELLMMMDELKDELGCR